MGQGHEISKNGVKLLSTRVLKVALQPLFFPQAHVHEKLRGIRPIASARVNADDETSEILCFYGAYTKRKDCKMSRTFNLIFSSCANWITTYLLVFLYSNICFMFLLLVASCSLIRLPFRVRRFHALCCRYRQITLPLSPAPGALSAAGVARRSMV